MNLANVPDSFMNRTPGPKRTLSDAQIIEFLSVPGRTYKDAAEEFGCSESTISHRVPKIRARVKAAREEEAKRNAPEA